MPLSFDEMKLVSEVRVAYRIAVKKARGRRVDYNAIVKNVAKKAGYAGAELSHAIGRIKNAHRRYRQEADPSMGFSRSL